MMNEPYGWTIFCDDIREEVGGKSSFMGVYKGTMIINDVFPAIVPKFAMSINYRIFRGDTRLNDIDLKIFLPGDDDANPSVATVIPVSEIFAEIDTPTSAESSFAQISFSVILSPMILKEAGKIKVRGTGGAGLLKLGTLKVQGTSSTSKLEA